MEACDLQKIVIPLTEWYKKNARDLPWRKNTDAYRVWVSEIMLQQTRVDTVIAYYERFMRIFPTMNALAEGSEEQLLKLWEGLGYYARARNLQKAAKIICEKYQGIFPSQYDKILALPGIGAYTAGAISSIAFEKPVAAVDGNVLRVITRLTQDNHDITDEKFKKKITQQLNQIYPLKACGIFTQSLMELGAVVCVPNGMPKCEECPLKQLCGAYTSHTPLAFPVKKKKAARKIEQKTVLLLNTKNQIALHKRAAGGLLGGMWELPNLEGTKSIEELTEWLREQGLTAVSIKKGVKKKHIFTHIEWHMDSYIVDCENVSNAASFVWSNKDELENKYALPTAFKKFLSDTGK